MRSLSETETSTQNSPPKSESPVIGKAKLQNGGFLYAVRHPKHSQKVGRNLEEPMAYYQTNPKGNVTGIRGHWPNEYAIETDTANPHYHAMTLYWPKGSKRIHIYSDGSYEMLGGPNQKIRVPASPDNAEKIKNMIETHAYQAHQHIDKGYPFNDRMFHNFGIPSEKWSLPETHPLADRGLEFGDK